ncbi:MULTISPECIES: winged helix-turn-helix transcriptional regulator [Rhodanobacter]|uniref:Helix-turn-helix transcriptional regulator n=1 Tax=Rhodanobacter hydrolyticus TaxID=2250595 RepID=A0ABW8J7B0_9GAMM|nr:helix-turn-helix domain-containing protein [Rhodanobacter sp. 7MK24]MBD8882287.1 helix-turn-helix transcriptional regulator [Rhodanobacter sp. 7MK24]
MAAARQKKTFACPVDVTLSLIHGKWKPMILWLLSARQHRFSDFQAAMPQVAHKVLSQQLRQLEADGLICRAARDTGRQHMAYQLTGFGRSLRPALNALAAWGKDHHHALGAEYGAPVSEVG